MIGLLCAVFSTGLLSAAAPAGGHGDDDHHAEPPLPPSLTAYQAYEAEHGIDSLWGKLVHRAQADWFNVLATFFFFAAVVHTFAAGTFRDLAHRVEHRHRERIRREGRTAETKPFRNAKDATSITAVVLHFLGEIEAIFGIWIIPLLVSMAVVYGFHDMQLYIDSVNYTEAIFVVVIMAMAATRPILKLSERIMGSVAALGGRSPAAWWLSTLTVAPLLGSFITEPAAMTIAALLLGSQFYHLDPSPRLKYATLGLLFVNVSVGGTLTHFAAPPVLVVANTWGWDLPYMFTNFGWRAVLGIVAGNALYYLVFRKELTALKSKAAAFEDATALPEEPVPLWVSLGVVGFMAFTVLNLHHPALFIGGFLVFFAFVEATKTHQDGVSIKGPLLVGFFLAGLFTHGRLQQWWIAPVLGELNEYPLFFGSTLLTAFNDNAAITFLASQVPAFSPEYGGDAGAILRYAVVAGAVTGGGLTVIANAPNPAGQSLLQKYFQGGISPFGLLLGALVPTALMACFFILLPH